jgi:hypothetical protein
MNEKRIGVSLSDVAILPTTAGDSLIKYNINEMGAKFELTKGVHGQVFDFEDGTSILYTEDSWIITLHPDNSLTIYDDGEIEDIAANTYDEHIEFFYKSLIRALRGALDES